MWVLVLAACSRTRWEEVRIEDERTVPEDEGPAQARDALARFEAVAAADDAWLDEIVFVDEIAVPSGTLEHVDPEAEVMAGGIYLRRQRRIEVVRDDLPRSLRHELCHALDHSVDLSAAHEDWLRFDDLPPDIQRETAYLPGHEAAEVFAKLCEVEAPPWIDRILGDSCAFDITPPMVERAQALAFPGEVVPRLAPVDLSIRWLDPTLPTATSWLSAPQPIDGAAIVVLFDDAGGTRSRAAVARLSPDGGLDILAEQTDLSEITWGQAILPSDGEVVLLGLQGAHSHRLVGSQVIPLDLPDGWYVGGAVHGRLVVAQPYAYDEVLPLVLHDLETGVSESLAPPDGADAGSLALTVRGDALLLLSEGRSWQLEGRDWRPADPQTLPPLPQTRATARLADGREILSWYAWEAAGVRHEGLALRGADGAIALSVDACRPRDETFSAFSDGHGVWVTSGDTIGIVDVPPP